MHSCSTEEAVLQNESNIRTVTKNEAILFLRNQNTSSNTIAKTTNFNLDFDFDKITQEQLTNTSELLTVIPVKTKIRNHRSRALILRIGDTIKTMIYNEFTAASSTKNSFDGIIVMTRLNGDFIRAYKLKNNKYITDLAPKKGNKTGQNGTQSTSRTIDGGDLHEVIVINSYKDPSTFVSLNEMGKEVPISISWNSIGSGGDGISEEPNNLRIYNFLNSKARCINDLLDNNGNSFVQKLLANFEGNSEFDINIVSKDVVISKETGEEINASTTRPINETILITISTSKANIHANLVVARTLLHEYIHADIYRKTPILNNLNGFPDFKTTYDTYNQQYHHNNMATLYLNSMKEALKEFHKQALTNDYNNYTQYYGEAPSDAFYEALAWAGLKEHNVEAWIKLPDDKKTEIETLSKRINMLSKASPCTN